MSFYQPGVRRRAFHEFDYYIESFEWPYIPRQYMSQIDFFYKENSMIADPVEEIISELNGEMAASAVASSESVLLKRALVERIVEQLRHLRSMAGVVSQGESFGDIKRRQGPMPINDQFKGQDR